MIERTVVSHLTDHAGALARLSLVVARLARSLLSRPCRSIESGLCRGARVLSISETHRALRTLPRGVVADSCGVAKEAIGTSRALASRIEAFTSSVLA